MMMVRSIVPCNGTSVVPADNGFPSPVRRLRDGEKDGENTRVTSKNDTQMKKLSKKNELTQGNLRKKTQMGYGTTYALFAVEGWKLSVINNMAL